MAEQQPLFFETVTKVIKLRTARRKNPLTVTVIRGRDHHRCWCEHCRILRGRREPRQDLWYVFVGWYKLIQGLLGSSAFTIVQNDLTGNIAVRTDWYRKEAY